MPKIKFSKDSVWTFTTYFTEGFPYGIIRTVSSVFFRDMKVSLESIGLTPLFGLPWILKFLWGPQVDQYSSKRRWILFMQSLLLGMMVLAALFAPLKFNVQIIAVLFFVGAFFAATNDIAIDGYYMDALDKDNQAKYVGYRAMAFRIAWLMGPLCIVTIGTTLNWSLAFATAAFIFGLFFIYHILFLKEVEFNKKKFRSLFSGIPKIKTFFVFFMVIAVIVGIRLFFESELYSGIKAHLPILNKIGFAHGIALLLLFFLIMVGVFRKQIKKLILKDPDSFYSQAFILFMEREKISIILAFIIFLRAGEWTMTTMVAPFMVDLGIKIHYGWISGLVGLPASIIGAMLGGWMIYRFKLKRVIWPFILAQNLTNVIYMLLAIRLSHFITINTGSENPVSLGIINLVLVCAVHGFDQFASGLGTAVLMTYLMRICHQKYKAAHYAIGSGLMNVSSLFSGVMSGFIASWLGYAWLFGISFLVSIPAMALIPFLPYLSDNLRKKENPGIPD
jgi:PAT family beta-lactamase induction signal transducer AmpG